MSACRKTTTEARPSLAQFFDGLATVGVAIAVVGLAGSIWLPSAGAEEPEATSKGAVITSPRSSQPAKPGKNMDFENAQPVPLPATTLRPPSAAEALTTPPVNLGAPGSSAGSSGDGRQKPAVLFPPKPAVGKQSNATARPEEFGTSGHAYTTSMVNGFPSSATNYTANSYPYRASGKLWFNKPNDSRTWFCSASLIKRGLAVTAATAWPTTGRNNFTRMAFCSGIQQWNGAVRRRHRQVGDNFDVLLQRVRSLLSKRRHLSERRGRPDPQPPYVGTSAGWYSYGWNGYSYNGSGQALITQLGYPLALDSGLYMELTDSQGFVSASLSNNTIIGSLMTGGSSGGPWLVNLGMPPMLSGVSFGTAALHNVVVGVTSWGYTDAARKEQGASPFTSGNIVFLVNTACNATPFACA